MLIDRNDPRNSIILELAQRFLHLKVRTITDYGDMAGATGSVLGVQTPTALDDTTLYLVSI